MDSEYLRISVHNEYAKRMEDEHRRQDKRLTDLENVVEDIAALTASVASLAKSVEQMAKAQEKQGERLIALEQKPAQRWDNLVDKAVWALGAALIAFLLTKLGLS